MKFDLSKIMRRAWEIKRAEDIKRTNIKWLHNDFSALKDSEKALFGICLEMAWEEAKEVKETEEVKTGSKARVQSWFLAKKFGKEVDNFGDTIEILKETEKAVYGNVYYLNGMPMEIWCPKSCLC